MNKRVAKKVLAQKDVLNYGTHQIEKAERTVKNLTKNKTRRDAKAKA